MDILVQNEPAVHYPAGDQRGGRDRATFAETEMQLLLALKSPAGVMADCSEMVTELCHMAGLQDPNGLGYRYAGYTGTMLEHLPHYTKAKAANVGALVVFGPGTGHHVCMVRKPGANPLLFSHGQERGPMFISLSQEAKYQPAPTTFLSIAHLGG
jgi:hypothetical protein